MRYSLFISDLHLCASRPTITSEFLAWLNKSASKADALYILGDFFEYWAGDDVLDGSSEDADMYRTVAQALKALVESGVPVYFMHGNRDFLIGERFCWESGIALLPDPTLIELYGHSVLLSHGDTLCTDDIDYMAFKEQVRQSSWQSAFLSQSLEQRLDFIAEARSRSDAQKAVKSMTIMDVNQQAVIDCLTTHDMPSLFIHGHTHRPNHHEHIIDEKVMVRWVLGDWYEQGSCLQLNEDGSVISEPV